VLGVVLACYLAVLAHGVVQRPPYDPNRRLADWLQAHHLDYGLATYWNASVVTLDSGGRVQVRPVNWAPGPDRIVAVQWESASSWYDPRPHDARFLVLPGPRTGCSTGAPGQWLAAVRAAYGPPAASYRAVGAVILVWHKNLLDHVSKPVGRYC